MPSNEEFSFPKLFWALWETSRTKDGWEEKRKIIALALSTIDRGPSGKVIKHFIFFVASVFLSISLIVLSGNELSFNSIFKKINLLFTFSVLISFELAYYVWRHKFYKSIILEFESKLIYWIFCKDRGPSKTHTPHLNMFPFPYILSRASHSKLIELQHSISDSNTSLNKAYNGEAIPRSEEYHSPDIETKLINSFFGYIKDVANNGLRANIRIASCWNNKINPYPISSSRPVELDSDRFLDKDAICQYLKKSNRILKSINEFDEITIENNERYWVLDFNKLRDDIANGYPSDDRFNQIIVNHHNLGGGVAYLPKIYCISLDEYRDKITDFEDYYYSDYTYITANFEDNSSSFGLESSHPTLSFLALSFSETSSNFDIKFIVKAKKGESVEMPIHKKLLESTSPKKLISEDGLLILRDRKGNVDEIAGSTV